jgi:hypothetical protein
MEVLMKCVRLIAAAALALGPALAAAQDVETSEGEATTVEPGGVSTTGVLSIFSAGSIPAGAVVVGGLVIIGGAIVGTLVGGTEEESTVTPATST